MEHYRISYITFLVILYSFEVICEENNTNIDKINPDNVFNGVYTECFFHLSYSCLQKKTLLYLKELNNLSEVSVIGDYVKFVKINTTHKYYEDEDLNSGSTDELAFMIDKAVDDFFSNHILKFNALGRDISLPRNMDEFVGRKKRKGGGGGGGGGHMGHDDGGKKKMMMMAMMCMKMKLMMMVPAMMGMMGMMSFKGMMFSMMSFMLSKMMLLMKILEKKGGAGGSGGLGGGGGDGGWAASGGGGGAWMPAGGQDFGGGGGGGGYDANGQWQSRSILEENSNSNPQYYREFKHIPSYDNIGDRNFENVDNIDAKTAEASAFYENPEISFVKPVVRYNNQIESEVYKNPVLVYKKSNVDFTNYGIESDDDKDVHNTLINTENKKSKRSVAKDLLDHIRRKRSIEVNENLMNNNVIRDTVIKHNRRKRSILDLIQNSYMYWMNTLLGTNNNRRTNFQRYKIINGVRYVYYPLRTQKPKMPKEVQLTSAVKLSDDFKPIITAEDFNKGEIMEGAVESRMNKKKFHKMKDTVNDAVEDNPWE